MKLLLIADKPSNNLQYLLKDNPDLIITLGDLEDYGLLELNNYPNIPKIGIYGNHEGDTLEKLGIQNLHLTKFNFGGNLFGGFEGCVKYKEKSIRNLYTQDESIKMLSDFSLIDIFISHCPLYGIHDEVDDLSHQGFRGIKKYIEKHKPKYLFHGHTYPIKNIDPNKDYIKETIYCDTKIIWIYGAITVEI